MDEIESAGGSTIDLDFISHEQRIDLLAAYQRARAQLNAREQVLLYRMATDPLPPDRRGNLDKEWVREDVAWAMNLAPVTAQDRLNTTHDTTMNDPDPPGQPVTAEPSPAPEPRSTAEPADDPPPV
jgi:hypothetical protein